MKDYYKILGINRDASDDEVKKAYRKLAHQFHPDKPSGDEQKFKEINEAYQILSDRQKRSTYDRFGTADFGAAAGQGPFGGWDTGGAQWGDFGGQVFTDFGDFGDIFESFFEGIGVKPKRRTYQKGSDIEVTEEVTLEEAFSGITKNFSIQTQIACRECGGLGHDRGAGMKTCAVCAGAGEIREQKKTFFGHLQQVKTCVSCSGTGKVPEKECKICRGKGRVSGSREITVEILPGIGSGQIIKVSGMGEAGEKGTEAGDLYVRIKLKKHPVFDRQGDDLIIRRDLSVADLLLGRKIEIPVISKGKDHGAKISTIQIEIPAGFNLKDFYRIPGEGMPHFGRFGRGDLLVDFIIKAPKKLSGRARDLLEGL